MKNEKERPALAKLGEDKASEYLEEKGYRIIERNVWSKLGEIDLVAEKEDALVFVEVKTGSSSDTIHPYHHFDSKKQAKLLLLGKQYLSRKREQRDARFDLVTVVQEGEATEIEHFEDVIHDTEP